jgi:hypothetical protein
MELILAGVSAFLAFLDAAITHFGLKGGRVEELNPPSSGSTAGFHRRFSSPSSP